MNLLELKNVSVGYGKAPVIEKVSFALQRGETVVILGPNGSGKTTIFRAIIGALPYAGEIVMELDARIGYVPQKIDLERNLPLTVREFLLLAVKPKEVRAYSPEEAVKLVDLPKAFLSKNVSTLSSGEFQRTLIAFALINRPDLLLFDEPTASIDIGGQDTVYELLHRLQDDQNFGLILISHDLAVVYQQADKVLCLHKRHAHFGDPEEALTVEELKELYGPNIKFHRHAHI
ncbi:MAG: metal ABC transporter ATP-binding protein [Candidatus Wildermuthbacteria bacterium]|nr:metal ABC transporter ATP-binding protein [Candidatus Wildermuthbacteria bacterium]